MIKKKLHKIRLIPAAITVVQATTVDLNVPDVNLYATHKIVCHTRLEQTVSSENSYF